MGTDTAFAIVAITLFAVFIVWGRSALGRQALTRLYGRQDVATSKPRRANSSVKRASGRPTQKSSGRSGSTPRAASSPRKAAPPALSQDLPDNAPRAARSSRTHPRARD